MNAQRRAWIIIGIIGLIFVTMACELSSLAPQAPKLTATATSALSVTLKSLADTVTPTAGLSAGGSSGGTGGSSSGGTGGNSGGGNSGGGAGSANQGSSVATPEPTELADISGGPYTVKQIETLGGEAISGIVCSTSKPFSVLSVTSHVTFTFIFVPLDAQRGNVTYAYSIPSAGESHEAAGTYTLARVDKVGMLQLSLTVSDHVVFKGFDGNIPNRYKFNLVPSGGPPCP